MNVRITKADESRLRACHEVFLDSALYDHYFSQEGRLDRQLSTAISRGELWIALTSQDEVAGCMWMEPDGFFGAFPYLALLGVKKSFRGMGVGNGKGNGGVRGNVLQLLGKPLQGPVLAAADAGLGQLSIHQAEQGLDVQRGTHRTAQHAQPSAHDQVLEHFRLANQAGAADVILQAILQGGGVGHLGPMNQGKAHQRRLPQGDVQAVHNMDAFGRVGHFPGHHGGLPSAAELGRTGDAQHLVGRVTEFLTEGPVEGFRRNLAGFGKLRGRYQAGIESVVVQVDAVAELLAAKAHGQGKHTEILRLPLLLRQIGNAIGNDADHSLPFLSCSSK